MPELRRRSPSIVIPAKAGIQTVFRAQKQHLPHNYKLPSRVSSPKTGRGNFGRATRLYGIIGHPLGHTFSPAMQNAAFRAARIDAHYVAIAIDPARIKAALRGLRQSGLAGFNVTVPYKETVMPFLAAIDPSARAAGAVNAVAIHPKTGRWTGHNTDIYGFRILLARARIDTRGARVLVLGAGGAARAVCAAIVRQASRITIHNRTPARAKKLRLAFPAAQRKKIVVISSAAASRNIGPFDLVINATSLGLRSADRPALPAGVFEGKPAVIDLIYNPPDTRFLRAARNAGCRAAGGLDMLLHQGARAFEIWTGRTAPVFAMRRALTRELARMTPRRRRPA